MFLYVLWRAGGLAGWRAGGHPGDPTGQGTPPHHAYVIATTATFAGFITYQVGTVVAARTDHASLHAIAVFPVLASDTEELRRLRRRTRMPAHT
ncbi:hypothetical protein [Streptomyces sp. ICC4]|uniref:hypothetical protein n=1 Tax=Streptomyces sp. ICC4 TaxID=2099584 RepID=UPI00195516E3|nr:hypothetical protein [Streptomyces sp. ICC4]